MPVLQLQLAQFLGGRSPAEKTKKKLDKYIELRCEIAHRGRAGTAVTKTQVVKYLDLITKIAARTGGVVNTHVKEITGKSLW